MNEPRDMSHDELMEEATLEGLKAVDRSAEESINLTDREAARTKAVRDGDSHLRAEYAGRLSDSELEEIRDNVIRRKRASWGHQQ